MTKMENPEDIFRISLEGVRTQTEDTPPSIKRVEVWPYPELTRLWVRVEVTPFVAFPNLELIVRDPDQSVASTMFMVEIREVYQSFTMHLRQAPRAGESYTLKLELTRDDTVLDARTLPFDLVFHDPKETKSAS